MSAREIVLHVALVTLACGLLGCPEPPVAPTAAFNANPTEGAAPLTVQFTDTSVHGTAPITSWSWDFGDGGASTEPNPSYVYMAEGTYTASLTVTSAAGSDTATMGGPITVSGITVNLVKRNVQTAAPNYVNILFQVLDASGVGVTDLEASNFEVEEDGVRVSPMDSHNEVLDQERLPYTLYTVLMLDTSDSVGVSLGDIKAAAKLFVQSMTRNQQIAVCDFSEQSGLVIDFTGYDGRQDLLDTIDAIALGSTARNLYGAAIDGVERWIDRYQLGGITQGSLVLLTNGIDTAGLHTLTDALDARGGKRVYTIGTGADIEPEALRSLGNGGYYPLANFSELSDTFAAIQADIDAYANSFYLLRYNSPKRGDTDHDLSLCAAPDMESNTITGSFNSANFYSVSPGVYVNDGYGSHEGIGSLDMQEGPGQESTFEVHTYFGTPGVEPVFSCETGDESLLEIVSIQGDTITIRAIAGGETTLTVRDTVNGFERVLDITIFTLVPDVYDMAEAEAVATIEAAGLMDGSISYAVDGTVASGNVLSQSPASGTLAAPGTPIALTVARYVSVPDVYHVPEADAMATIEATGLTVGSISYTAADNVSSGDVVSQDPAPGTLVTPGDPIDLTVKHKPIVFRFDCDSEDFVAEHSVTLERSPGYMIAAPTGIDPYLQNVLSVPGDTLTEMLALIEVRNAPTAEPLRCGFFWHSNTGWNFSHFDVSEGLNLVRSDLSTHDDWDDSVDIVRFDLPELYGQYSDYVDTVFIFDVVVFAEDQNFVPEPWTINSDCDDDGLSNDDEASRGTDPYDTDTDGDGVSDGLEVQNGSDPLDPEDTVTSGDAFSQASAEGTPIGLEVPPPFALTDRVAVPNVYDMPEADAVAVIEGAGLTAGWATEVHSQDASAGNVVLQKPAAGSTVSPGSAVDVWISIDENP